MKNKAALARKFGVSRAEGILFLGYYIAYTLYLVLASTHHDALPVFSSVMNWFVIPLTVIVLCITVYQQSFIRK